MGYNNYPTSGMDENEDEDEQEEDEQSHWESTLALRARCMRMLRRKL